MVTGSLIRPTRLHDDVGRTPLVNVGEMAELGLTRSRTAAGFAIKEFVQPPNRRLPWHDHRDASICFVISGSYTERVGSLEEECGPHAVVFKPAGERHTDRFGARGGTCLLIEIEPQRLLTIQPVTSITAKPVLVRNLRLAALGQHIWREFVAGDRLSLLAIEGLVLEALVEASRTVVHESTLRRPPWLRQAHDLIHERYGEPLTLSGLAQEVGVHPSHLARSFKQHYRRTIGDTVRRLRVERAVRDLPDANLSLAKIAVTAGFYDQSHFSRAFKAITGVTPGEFRKTSIARHARTITQRVS